ncbi:probable serine/threonine-protein kinase nek1 [Leptopilina heterotoma]|uniref:probable serine/threonine-protein kinase nek1 n=1 Tax=Leptopilina heterotoma TaxID=63436 RepID=UPI001CA8442B|nr:probable serine/threonine-protein kinase nek1 [Leptopilina heterotoma]
MTSPTSDEFVTDDDSDREGGDGVALGSRRNNRFRPLLKLPGFYHKEPSVWFAQVELLFNYARVNSERAKAGAVLAVLDFETVMTLSDLITLETPPADIYKQIKIRLISNFSVSSEARLRQLLKGELSEEGKPSLILNRIRALSQGKCSDEIIKTVFVDHLPANCRAALALMETTDIDKLAELADRFVEASGPNCTQQVATVSSENVQEKMMKLIEDLSARVNAISDSNRFRSPQRSSNYKNQYRSKSANNRKPKNNNFNRNMNGKGQNNSNNNDNRNSSLCFYHAKFGDKALKCVPPCIRNSGTSSGN